MADRVSASIRFGGALPRVLFPKLLAIIANERLSTDYGGEPFEPHEIPIDSPLELMDNEVAWGSFGELEAFCIEQSLPFQRWSGAYPGSFEAERLVFDGAGQTRYYTATDSDAVIITESEAKSLGSFDAIEAYFASANITIPPLLLTDEPVDGGRHG